MKTYQILILTAIIAFTGCTKKQPESQSQNNSYNQPKSVDTSGSIVYAESGIGMKAPALEGLEFVKGSPVTIQNGQVYIVEFWATWCGPCLKSIPHLTEIQRHYKDKNLTVIGVSTESVETVKPFVEEQGDKMDYTVVVDLDGKVKQNYSKAFNQRGIPHAFVVDQQRRIVWVGHPMADLDEVLSQVLQGTFDPVTYEKQKAEKEAVRKQIQQLYTQYFNDAQSGISGQNTTEMANQIIEKASANTLNSFAWDILTKVPEQSRQLDIALQASEKANEMTESKNPAILDTYALALFQSGKVTEAIATEEKAVQLCPEGSKMKEEMTKVLEKFKAASADM